MEQLATQKPPGAGKSSYDLIDPGVLWAGLDLPQGITFLDLGCGQGITPWRPRRVIGPTGVVYAVDLWEEGIAALKERAAREGRANLKALVAPAGQIPVADVSVDVGFMATVLHDLVEAGTAAGALAELARVIKPGSCWPSWSLKRSTGRRGRPGISGWRQAKWKPWWRLRVCPAEDGEAGAVQLLDDVCESVEAGFGVKVQTEGRL